MRMRRRNNLAPRMEACESVWIHDPEALRGNWRSLMPDCRELRVEVGCGKGKFTVETAEAEPDVLLIAIERVQDALVLAMEAAIRKGLKNVFFVSLDAANIDQFFADDEIDLLKPHIMFLRSKGYEPVTVNNGHDALELVESRHFDMVILDENMPGLTGMK